MKRGATKEDIIRATHDLITRNGIRAVRVDEIAQTLGISKRTLYEMFADKNDLVSACLDFMSSQQRKHICAYRKRRIVNSLKQVFKLTNEYIAGLFMVESSFLTDLRYKVVYAEHFDEHRGFWRNELAHHIEASREEGLLLPEVDAKAFADRILESLLELRLNNALRKDVDQFCKTLLRGAATQRGIDMIDRKR
ncbi:TetR/AcrR family transcriptional regulator [uncultured Alistipes sp.]|jgi:transcriptional regulator|uniref:TetR/AcrR family transcriptional regulator n=1 Tax=uncultured Alistipes sp. TaxID=538949 RepID=UPI0025DF300E|nr:TetR/AcrR family transcriptional regulator [uncultured Alistipes sp.]